MSARMRGKKLVSNLTVTATLVSIGVASIGSVTLWSDSVNAKAALATSTTGSTDSFTRHDDDSSSSSTGSTTGGTQSTTVTPSQGSVPQATSSGS